MKNNFSTLLLLLLTVSCFSQEISYEVDRIYPYISITKEKLNDAQTIMDLNDRYKSSWVKEYISIEILTIYKGDTNKAVSKNATLTQEQKNILNMADAGTDVSVNIQYIPNNTLAYNDIKEVNFSFSVDPKNEAKYPGGQQQLNQYIKEKAIDKIPDTIFKEYDVAAIKFTISEEGQIVDAHIFQTSEEEEIDKLLLETICNMPNWTPAEYGNGTKVKQEYVLLVGNMESCIIGLLNIGRLSPENDNK